MGEGGGRWDDGKVCEGRSRERRTAVGVSTEKGTTKEWTRMWEIQDCLGEVAQDGSGRGRFGKAGPRENGR